MCKCQCLMYFWHMYENIGCIFASVGSIYDMRKTKKTFCQKYIHCKFAGCVSARAPSQPLDTKSITFFRGRGGGEVKISTPSKKYTFSKIFRDLLSNILPIKIYVKILSDSPIICNKSCKSFIQCAIFFGKIIFGKTVKQVLQIKHLNTKYGKSSPPHIWCFHKRMLIVHRTRPPFHFYILNI